jgi:hypothetical protein
MIITERGSPDGKLTAHFTTLPRYKHATAGTQDAWVQSSSILYATFEERKYTAFHLELTLRQFSTADDVSEESRTSIFRGYCLKMVGCLAYYSILKGSYNFTRLHDVIFQMQVHFSHPCENLKSSVKMNSKRTGTGWAGIAICYGLDGRGVGVRVPAGAGTSLVSTSSRPVLRTTQPPIQQVTGALSPRVKRPGREADH